MKLRYVCRARLTLPHFLQLVQDEDGNLHVLTKEVLPPRMKLGPIEARKTVQQIENEYSFILKVQIVLEHFYCV